HPGGHPGAVRDVRRRRGAGPGRPDRLRRPGRQGRGRRIAVGPGPRPPDEPPPGGGPPGPALPGTGGEVRGSAHRFLLRPPFRVEFLSVESPSGRWRSPRKRVKGNLPWVQIPPPPLAARVHAGEPGPSSCAGRPRPPVAGARPRSDTGGELPDPPLRSRPPGGTAAPSPEPGARARRPTHRARQPTQREEPWAGAPSGGRSALKTCRGAAGPPPGAVVLPEAGRGRAPGPVRPPSVRRSEWSARGRCASRRR